jgi:hypothetical protein
MRTCPLCGIVYLPLLPDENCPPSMRHKCDPRDVRVKALEDRVTALGG